MNRQLLLLRHAKSDWNVDVSDFERPLKRRGKRAAQRLGAWLRSQNLVPDLILSSPAERARNTAEKLTKAMGLTVQQIQFDTQLYDAELKDLKQVLARCPSSANRVLLVAHNPGLEELLMFLNKDKLTKSEDNKVLPTATLAILEMPDNWQVLSKRCAKLQTITRPDSLPKRFPFNGLTGIENRKRPAYYYSQSAAIPYQIKDNELQILLVSSSGKNHWVVPKGIIEPGLTASSSAVIEAWEEAGVVGNISEQMLGYYQYEKWGNTCTVQVYPLAVTQLITDSEWDENYRSRLWLSFEKARSLIKQKQMQTLFDQLARLINSKKV